MKALALAALLLATPALVAESFAQAPAQVVREFAANGSAAGWTLGPGWSWTDGVLTHAPGQGTEAASQVAMPEMIVGKTYRVSLGFKDYKQGTVEVALGGESVSGYGASGSYTLFPVAKDPAALLTITPSDDYDGTIARVRVVELGDELVGQGQGQGQGGPLAGLTRQVGVVEGHTYVVTFDVDGLPEDAPPWLATVSLAGSSLVGFSHNGTYARDMVAAADGDTLVFAGKADATADLSAAVVGAYSVREITSDPVTP